MAPTPTYEELKPTQGDPAQSHQYMFDVAALPVTPATEPSWQNIPDITALSPEFQAQLQEITTYAHKGQQAQSKVGSNFSLSFNLLKLRDNTGEFQPEWLVMKNASDQLGELNMLRFRFYDSLGASDAYEGTATVARGARPENGAVGVGWDAWSLTGVGEVLPIENPLKRSTTP